MWVESLSAQEELDLIERYQAGDKRADDALVLSCRPYVVKQVMRLRGYRLDFDELIQEAFTGLVKALPKFDVSKGVRFLSYAHWWVVRCLDIYIRTHAIPVTLGYSHKGRRLFYKAGGLYNRTQAANPDATHTEVLREVADKLDAEPKEVEESLARFHQPVSLDAGTAFLVDTPERSEEHLSVFDDVTQSYFTQQVVAKAVLDPRQRFIIQERYLSCEPRTLQSLAEALCLSRERVRQLEATALQALRRSFVARPVYSRYVGTPSRSAPES